MSTKLKYSKLTFGIFLAIGLSFSGFNMLFGQTKVILKLDDLGVLKGRCAALPVMEFLLKRNIKASYGVIASKLDETAKDVLKTIISETNKRGEPMVEIWNHGLYHSRKDGVFEFKNTPYELQKQYLDSSEVLIQKYLGLRMTGFGAPFNAIDTTCLRAISERANYRYVFFSNLAVDFNPSFKTLNNHIRMENGTGNPDFDSFVKNLNINKQYLSDYIVLQAHPNNWTIEKLESFKQILNHLDRLGCEFILPSQL